MPKKLALALSLAEIAVVSAMLSACSTTRYVAYDTTEIRRVYARPLQLSLRVQSLRDARGGHPPSALLFRGDNETQLDGHGVCVNAEEHYAPHEVPAQVSRLVAAHLSRRGLFAAVTTGARSRSDYVLTGSLQALYGVQETSTAAAVGAQLGLIGALLSSGATTQGRIQIAFSHLQLFDSHGREISRLPDVFVNFQGELGADAYCWAIYDHVNAKLKEAIDALALSVEQTVRAAASRPLAPAEPAPGISSEAQAASSNHLAEAERRELAQAQRAREQSQWESDHRAWQARAEPLRERRGPLTVAAIATALGGAALIVTGVALESNASAKNDDALALAARWRTVAAPAERTPLEHDIDRIQTERDRANAFGIVSFAVGGAGLAASAVLWALRPGLPEEPQRPFEDRSEGAASGLAVHALIGPRSGGLAISGGL